MAKLYGKNQLKKLIDGHNDVVLAKINLIEKVIGRDRDYITDVIAKEYFTRFIPVPKLMYTPWTKDGFFSNMYGKNEPTKHQKNFELLLLEWCYNEPDPVRP